MKGSSGVLWAVGVLLPFAGGCKSSPMRAPGATDAGVETAPAPGPAETADAAESDCVIAAVRLPWSTAPSGERAVEDFELVAAGQVIAVMNRQRAQSLIRIYTRDGTFIAEGQFSADAQLIAHPDDRFMVISRDTGQNLVASAFDASFTMRQDIFTVPAATTEHLMAVTRLPAATVLLTNERFLNLDAQVAVAWTAVLSADEAGAFKTGRVYGLAPQPDRVLIAWGASDILGTVVMKTSGELVASAIDAKFLGYMASLAATAVPHAGGLLLFDSNPLRLTQIDFDLSRKTFGINQQLKTFYRTAAKVAGVATTARPVGFWLTVFPVGDNSQGTTPHQLYGCELDVDAPDACAGKFLVANTRLTGYEIVNEPLAAIALPGSDAFAIAHTDGSGDSWLRVAGRRCAR